MRIILIYLIVLFLNSCIANKNKYDDFSVRHTKWTSDNEFINEYNINNTIYLPERQFIYSYYFMDSLENKLFCKVFENDFAIKKKIQLGRLEPYEKFDSTQVDIVRLFVFKGKSDMVSYNEETFVKYDYFNVFKKKGFLRDLTGVVEDENGVFLHPSRNLCFNSLYFSAYPRIKYPLKIGKSWIVHPRTLKYVQPYLEAYNYNNFPLDLQFSFEITEKETIKTPFKKLSCYKIEGIEISGALPDNISTFYFNEEYGFVKQVYYDSIKKTTLVIELEDVIDPK